MDTPDKNRISAVSLSNIEDSPVFQYINDLSPIEPVKGSRPDNVLHSLAFTSPLSLFSSPQMNSYRDSRFSIKRHRSSDLPSPIFVRDETVKRSLDILEAVKTSGPCEEKSENVSKTKPFEEQVGLAIELVSQLNNGKDGCDTPMGSCDVAPSDAENDLGRGRSEKQSDELCRQPSDPVRVVPKDVTIEEMELEIGPGAQNMMFDVAGIQNSEQEVPTSLDLRLNSGNIVESRGSCSVQVAAGAPDITLSSSSNIAAFDSTVKADYKVETGLHPSRKQRSVRRRCLTFDIGGSYKRIPLRDSTNDLPPNFASINEAPSPQKRLDSSKQDSDEILPIPQTIGLHLNGLTNSSVSSDRNKLFFKDGRVLSHSEVEFSTPVSTRRDLVSCDNNIMEEASVRSMEVEGVEEPGSCKRCKCRKSKCLKLYCDCFAAGLYCIGPCLCQDCFNRPAHAEMVMKTRKDIEARNPLAFTPKVILTSGSAMGFKDENNKTPASARHKRGCNCKKSGCTKKYCECFLMGVGCSSSCRCEGCVNVFGHSNEQVQYPHAVDTMNEGAYESR